MWKAALVGAIALATIGMSGVSAQEPDGTNVVVTESQIARFKAALRLTSAQERHWPPVEAALRSLAKQRQAPDESSGGMVYRLSSKAAGIVVDAMGFKRIAAAAGPLLRSLDDEQKQSAMSAASAMGFSNLASAF
jgi:zinc resistance-associated protein